MNKILESKYQAIDKFREGLLQSSVGDKIARLILFGSVLSGETSEESDIDLLVVAIDELKKVEETGADISFDILLASLITSRGSEQIWGAVCQIRRGKPGIREKVE